MLKKVKRKGEGLGHSREDEASLGDSRTVRMGSIFMDNLIALLLNPIAYDMGPSLEGRSGL